LVDLSAQSPDVTMPQGRHKTPFSGKAKKVQMQQKRDRVQHRKEQQESLEDNQSSSVNVASHPQNLQDLVQQTSSVSAQIKVVGGEDKLERLVQVLPDGGGPGGKGGGPRGGRGGGRPQSLAEKFQLKFQQESKADLLAKKERARQPYKRIKEESALELDSDNCFPSTCDFPIRPEWSAVAGKAQLEASESKYFREYVEKLMEEHKDESLSYFELNLETWRQLWRVLERSDIMLLVVDARYPAAMFPPSLYRYVTKTLGKHLILVLNKVDLIPAALALAWKDYFVSKFPNLEVVYFSSCPSYNVVGLLSQPGLKFRRMRGRISMVTEGARQIYDACARIVSDRVDLSSWRDKIDGVDSTNNTSNEPVSTDNTSVALTLGMVGQPNAGKSSLINSLMGKRVVSVSKTPGHTKHFQTIHITRSVVLMDCPGLVFPSVVDRPLQVVLGSYPVAQVREPFSVVQFLAEKVDLVSLLKLDSQREINRNLLSAYDVCEFWAINRGYVTARSNRPDVSRSANHILRMALEGKISLAYYPPGYISQNKKEEYENHPDLVRINNDLLALDRQQPQQEAGDDGDNFGNLDSCSEEDENSDSSEGSKTPEMTTIVNKFALLDDES